MPDPMRDGVALLIRGHRLYAGDDVAPPAAQTPQTLHHHADRLVRSVTRDGTGAAAPLTRRLAAGLTGMAAVDTEAAALLTRARTERELGRRATRALLDDALADTMPAADTALGQREALRRMTARLRGQRRHVRRSRCRARDLTRRMRRLTYPHRHRAAERHRVAAHAIPVRAVRFARAAPSGTARNRIAHALDRLGITDPAARRNWLRGYETLIARESGGRALAVATEPATAPGPLQPDGHRLGYARGLTQTLPATFAQYHQPGTSTNIYDPVANICASINYVMHRYGVTADGANLVALVQQADSRRPPKGY
ncbi:transglycosylase [Mycobacterium sp. pUA109]|uniref:transglycosylase n=1 Tax=Mycobacterium sp. pUA109 TaxID=3238982 RepID=UPI00351AC937